MIRDATFTVDVAQAGRRLDAVLLERWPTSTRALAQRALMDGRVRVNGQAAHKGFRVAGGERVAVAELLERADARANPNPELPLDVCHVDDDVVAVCKPAGMDVHPLRPDERGTLANALVARYPELAGIGDQPLMAGIVHRIDGDTSGLVLAARTPAAYERLRAQFAAQTVRKTYLALVAGAVERAGELVHDLAHQPWRRGRMVEARRLREPVRPMHAVTAYRPLRRVGAHTLLEVTIFTGVTHQIRCQLSLAGHPIAGDALYGIPPFAKGGTGGEPAASFDRHFLHAAAIDLAHPRTGLSLHIACPLTADLQAWLAAAGGRTQTAG